VIDKSIFPVLNCHDYYFFFSKHEVIAKKGLRYFRW